MNELTIAAPGGAKDIRVAPGAAAFLRVARSRAWHELRRGETAIAARLALAIADALPAALEECERQLTATPAETVTTRLGALLALTAGVGMTDDDRSEWLAAAVDALHGIPADLLDRGVKAARIVADHPSKITPLIMKEILPAWRGRLRDRGIVRELARMAIGRLAVAPAPIEDVPACDPADVARLNRTMRRFGCRTRYHADGSDFQLSAGDADPADEIISAGM